MTETENLNTNIDTNVDEIQEQEQENTVTDEAILNALKAPSETVKAALDKMIADAVKKALAGSTPKKSTVKVEPITKEKFDEMTYSEREKLFNENRDLYNKLTR